MCKIEIPQNHVTSSEKIYSYFGRFCLNGFPAIRLGNRVASDLLTWKPDETLAVVGHSVGAVVAFHVVALHVACVDKDVVDTLVEAHLALVHQVVAQHQVVEVPRAVGGRGLHQEVPLQVNCAQLQVVHLGVRLVGHQLPVVHQVVHRVVERLVAEHFAVVHQVVARQVVAHLVVARLVELPSVERPEVGDLVEHPVANLVVEHQPLVVHHSEVATVLQVGCLEDHQVGCLEHDLQVVLPEAVALHHVPLRQREGCFGTTMPQPKSRTKITSNHDDRSDNASEQVVALLLQVIHRGGKTFTKHLKQAYLHDLKSDLSKLHRVQIHLEAPN